MTDTVFLQFAGAQKTESEPGVPSGLSTHEFVSLVVRQPKPITQLTHNRDGTSTWKGKVIKNFKRFRKVRS